jgi:hypothetical protein
MVKRNKQRNRNRRPGRNSGRRGRNLPSFVPTVCTSHTFRFQSAARSGTVTITRGNLLNLLVVATSAVTTARILEAVRLKRVRMVCQPAALGGSTAATEITLEWLGENSPSTIIDDQAVGVQPAIIDSTPPASASNRWWCMSGTQEADNMFALTFEVGTVVDVTLELRFVDNETPTAGDVPVGATLGRMYGDYLDGITSAQLSPVGLTILP